ncbi:DUF1513 domain-containing protein [Zavarzinia sp.]|uniref:DUF1513 domain-containing protein n=1 Tax=Zavarzinia sp. TaxID=2027920 RepID=UPI003BB72785
MSLITRRAAGIGLAAAGLLAGLGLAGRRARAASPLWFGTRLDGGQAAYATAFDADGQAVIDLPLPARGHGIAIAPNKRLGLVMGRRPGLYALAVDLPSGKVIANIAPPEGRHFCGHAVFSGDGRLLLATETDWEGERGLIGVYDAAAGFARIAEWDSGGLDPHDVRLLPGGTRIIVANGGILTHPDAPGAKLNLAEMDSSLAIIDLGTGAIEKQIRLAPGLFQLSLRHLVIGAEGSVGFVMQYEGPATDAVPLAGLLRPDGTVELLDMPRERLSDLRHYCGSASTDASGAIFGMTSPRGGQAAFFRFADGAYLGSRPLSDVCPIAADPAAPGRFYMAGGHGGIDRVTPGATEASLSTPLARGALWDNHMALV